MKTQPGPNDIPMKAIRLREQWEVMPPDRSVAPNWMKRRVTEAITQGKLPRPDTRLFSGWDAFDFAAKHCGKSWCDHVGRLAIDDSGQVLVSEPYAESFTEESRQQLQRFCAALGLEWTESRESWHYPGCTIRIIVSLPN